jgi:carbon storage regulator CsrA
MLILTRRLDQKITVDGPITITIVQIRKDAVQIGFEGIGTVVRDDAKNRDVSQRRKHNPPDA